MRDPVCSIILQALWFMMVCDWKLLFWLSVGLFWHTKKLKRKWWIVHHEFKKSVFITISNFPFFTYFRAIDKLWAQVERNVLNNFHCTLFLSLIGSDVSKLFTRVTVERTQHPWNRADVHVLFTLTYVQDASVIKNNWLWRHSSHFD